MKKRKYEKPSIEVVVLKQQTRLMAGSVQSPSNTVDDYNWNTEVEE